MIVAPFSFVKEVPLSGLAGMVDAIPLLGDAMKKHFVLRHAKKNAGRSAWPNRLAKKSFVPELFGDFSPTQIAESIFSLLLNSRELQRQRCFLKELAGAVVPGAPSKICDILERMAASHGE